MSCLVGFEFKLELLPCSELEVQLCEAEVSHLFYIALVQYHTPRLGRLTVCLDKTHVPEILLTGKKQPNHPSNTYIPEFTVASRKDAPQY